MMSEQDWLTKSIFTIKQDVRLLGQYVIKKNLQST